jgi:D-sedoheptulose 7-phosphate isomerase
MIQSDSKREDSVDKNCRIGQRIIGQYIERVCSILSELDVEKIERVVEILQAARLDKRRIFIFGNGGSAATASHFACDLNKGAICLGQPRFRAIALTDSQTLVSAWAIDTSYEDIFAQQLENHVDPGDIVIGISGRGNSMNVVNALKLANLKGATTIALTGFDGGKVKYVAHVCIIVNSTSMEQVEGVHLLLEHAITTCLRVTGTQPVRESVKNCAPVADNDKVNILNSPV